jgi:hypothetical protein
MEGWRQPAYVLAFMVALELFTNLVLETVLYAGAAGVSQVGLLVAVTFWTWLWGAMGLVMAIPLTVCVVVVGKHVRGLEYLATLMADTSALTPAQGFYQRLLVRDTERGGGMSSSGTWRRTAPARCTTRCCCRRWRRRAPTHVQGRLDADGRQQMIAAIREMAIEAVEPAVPAVRRGRPTPSVRRRRRAGSSPCSATGWAAPADDLALDLFSSVVADLPLTVDTLPGASAADVVEQARAQRPAMVCLVDLAPVSAARTRYLVRRLKQARPELVVFVGRWGGAGVAEEAHRLVEAGAAHVGATADETRGWLIDALASASAAAPRPRRAS